MLVRAGGVGGPAGVGAGVARDQPGDGQHGGELVHPADRGAGAALPEGQPLLGPGDVDGPVALEDGAGQAEPVPGLQPRRGRERPDLRGDLFGRVVGLGGRGGEAEKLGMSFFFFASLETLLKTFLFVTNLSISLLFTRGKKKYLLPLLLMKLCRRGNKLRHQFKFMHTYVHGTYPTNNALLTNFRLSSDSEISLISTD